MTLVIGQEVRWGSLIGKIVEIKEHTFVVEFETCRREFPISAAQEMGLA